MQPRTWTRISAFGWSVAVTAIVIFADGAIADQVTPKQSKVATVKRADAKVPDGPKADTVALRQLRHEFIEGARDAIKLCGKKHDAYIVMLQAGALADQSSEDAARAMARLKGGTYTAPKPSDPVEQYHKKCVETAKVEKLDGARAFVSSYTQGDEKSRAREMVAQWMTALDAIGEKNDSSEVSKFNTLANGLLLDLQ